MTELKIGQDYESIYAGPVTLLDAGESEVWLRSKRSGGKNSLSREDFTMAYSLVPTEPEVGHVWLWRPNLDRYNRQEPVIIREVTDMDTVIYSYKEVGSKRRQVWSDTFHARPMANFTEKFIYKSKE